MNKQTLRSILEASYEDLGEMCKRTHLTDIETGPGVNALYYRDARQIVGNVALDLLKAFEELVPEEEKEVEPREDMDRVDAVIGSYKLGYNTALKEIRASLENFKK